MLYICIRNHETKCACKDRDYGGCRSLNCENSSVGRARPCQGRGRGFESRFSLQGCSSGGIGRHARLKILCPLGRAGSSPASST